MLGQYASRSREPRTSLFGYYRIRKIFNEWCVMVDGLDEFFSTYIQARAYADRLERQGYTDGDK